MCSKSLYESREKNLSNLQQYMFKSTLFIVQPIFKEDGDKTLGKALISLMKDEISKN